MLDQGNFRISSVVGAVKVVKNREHAGRCDFEKGSEALGSACRSHAIEVAVARLHQAGRRLLPVSPIKRVQNCDLALRRELEYDTVTLRVAARRRCSVEITVGTLNQWTQGFCSVDLVKLVQKRDSTSRRHFEHRTAAHSTSETIGCSGLATGRRCSIEVAIGPQNKGSLRVVTAGRKQIKQRAFPPRSELVRDSVDLSIVR